MQYIDKFNDEPYPEGWRFDPRCWAFGIEWDYSEIWLSIGPIGYTWKLK